MIAMACRMVKPSCCIRRGLRYHSVGGWGVGYRGFMRLLILLMLIAPILQGCASSSDPHKGQSGTSVSTDVLISRYQAADAAYRDQRWAEAVEEYQGLLAMLPDDAFLWLRMGNALAQIGRYGEAIAAFESSVRADPAQFKARFNLSTVHLLAAQAITQNLMALPDDVLSQTVHESVKARSAAISALLQ